MNHLALEKHCLKIFLFNFFIDKALQKGVNELEKQVSKLLVFKVLKLCPIVNNASKKYTLNLKKKNLKTSDHKFVKERLVRVRGTRCGFSARYLLAKKPSRESGCTSKNQNTNPSILATWFDL